MYFSQLLITTYPHNFFVCLIIDFHCSNNFFNITKNHIKMLIISLQIQIENPVQNKKKENTYQANDILKDQNNHQGNFYKKRRDRKGSRYKNSKRIFPLQKFYLGNLNIKQCIFSMYDHFHSKQKFITRTNNNFMKDLYQVIQEKERQLFPV